MKYVFTDFFDEFECVGGICPDTCCAGWNVSIDNATMQKYCGLDETQKNWICSCIKEVVVEDKPQNMIKMKEDGRCPFLNDRNLCDIYLQVSPDALSHVCQTYPRKIVSYYDVILITVCVSCPEAARIVLKKKEPIAFEYAEDDSIADTNGADWLLYNELINGLVITTDILQNRSYAIWERVYLVLEMTYQIQKHIEEGDLANLRKDIECYKSANWCNEKVGNIHNAGGRVVGCWNVVYDIMERIEKTKNINAKRKAFLLKYKILEKTEENAYYEWLNRFKEIEEETEFENLAVEFVFEYYMDALQGKNLFSNVIKMVLLLVLIRAYEVLHYNAHGELTEDNKIELVSKISRVMEHTHLLKEMAEGLLESNKAEELYKMAYLLY